MSLGWDPSERSECEKSCYDFGTRDGVASKVNRLYIVTEQRPLIFEIKIVFSAGRSSKGRTEAFEAFNRGSIPCLPAVQIIFNKTDSKSPSPAQMMLVQLRTRRPARIITI